MGKPPPIMAAMRPTIRPVRAGRPGLPQHVLHSQEVESCAQGHLPERYSRNGTLTSPAQQAMLLRGRVLLVGLGGLGGHVLDTLIRMGVGHLTGVDGDIFEASNLNRQLLCTQATLGMPKALAAAAHVARVNPATHFVPVARFVRGAELHALVRGEGTNPEVDESEGQGAGGGTDNKAGKKVGEKKEHGTGGYDLVVDALGGLDDRAALHAAAQAAGIPLVTAGIAGLTGWVQVVRGTATGPMHYFSHPQPPVAPTGATSPPPSASAEQILGNLAPTVCVAAGLQCAQVYALLTGAQPPTDMLVFDLQDLFFHTLAQP